MDACMSYVFDPPRLRMTCGAKTVGRYACNGTPFAHKGQRLGSQIRLGNEASVTSATSCVAVSSLLLSGLPARPAGAEKFFSVARDLCVWKIRCHFRIATVFVDGRSIGQRWAPEH